MDAVAIATSWKRPYSAMQRAWVDALGLQPSTVWADAPRRAGRRGPRRRDMREAMGQRYGVRGL